MGRHTIYTPELAAAICERIASGETMESIARDDRMPSSPTIYDWIDEKRRPSIVPASFDLDFARARALGHDVIAADCLLIADDGRNDWMARQAAGGDQQAMAFNAEHVQRSKLRIETRLKLLAKWSKKYADRMTHSGDAEAPLVTIIKDFGGKAG